MIFLFVVQSSMNAFFCKQLFLFELMNWKFHKSEPQDTKWYQLIHEEFQHITYFLYKGYLG